jgi:hypothetical protein
MSIIPALATRLHGDLIDETPQPVFTWLERLDDRVRGGVEVLRCVLVLGGITTPDVATNAAEPQMDPGVPDLQALLATVGRPWGNVTYLVEMTTRRAHPVSFLGLFRMIPSGPHAANDSGTGVETSSTT